MLSGKLNLRRGVANEIQVDIPSDRTEDIFVGDLVGIDGDIYTASEETWDATLATTQEAFVANFLGVSLQKHLVLCDADSFYAGGPRPVLGLIGTSGQYEYTIEAPEADLPVGTLVGPASNDDGDGLLSDAVAVVATAARAVGVIAETCVAGSTTCLVRIRSQVADRVL
jgi:hypothetical protein